MLAETRASVRNAGWLFVQHGGQVVSGVLFTLLIPRSMGLTSWGQYALISSLALWFIVGTRLGMSQVLGRYVPIVDGGQPLAELFGRLLTLQLAVSTGAALLFWLVTRRWLTEIDVRALTLMALTVIVRGGSGLFASLQHGLNRSARWGMSQFLRGWLTLGSLALGYSLAALPGATAGLLMAELLVLGVNLRWAWPHIGWPRPRLDLALLRPYLSLALVFAAAELVATSARHSGETILRLLQLPYDSIGHFGLALNIASMGTQALSQVVQSFLPLSVKITQTQDLERLSALLRAVLRPLTALAMWVAYAALLLGPVLIPAALGSGFEPVAVYLVPLVLLLVATPLGSAGRLLSIVSDRPRVALYADLVQLGSYWGLGVPLAAWQGGLGLSVAVLLSTLLSILYIYLALGSTARPPARAWAGVALLGLGGIPLCLLPIDGWARWLLWVAISAAYAAGLLATRLITTNQLRALVGLLRPSRRRAAPPQEVAAWPDN